MTAIHHKHVGDAVVAGISAWLTAKLPDGATIPPVLGSWPDFQAQAPSEISYIVVSMGEPRATPISPVLHTSIPGEGAEAVHVWRVGTLRILGQVDVFARTKLHAEELAHLVEQWFSTPPVQGGRAVTVTGYWNARYKIRSQSIQDGDASSPLSGRWRQTFAIQLDGPVLSDNVGISTTAFDVSLNASTFTVE